jgi:hypothetical protein
LVCCEGTLVGELVTEVYLGEDDHKGEGESIHQRYDDDAQGAITSGNEPTNQLSERDKEMSEMNTRPPVEPRYGAKPLGS